MSLQAIVMAGGEGVRLRPLTAHLPKPLAPLLGEPAMGYALKLLKIHGVSDIGVTLWYLPQKIKRAFGKGEGWGVKLRYYEEKEPLGTAGSVKMARKELDDTFFVLSGDGLTDCSLTDALKFHREKKALATLVLKRVSVPLPYGVVMTDRDSRITRFIEKPGWSRVFSDLVNTGIYILEPDILNYIADSGAPDFGKDVFPALLAGGLPVYGYETDGYWCDVGDLKTYLQAQRDLLEGKVNLPHPSGVDESVAVPSSARVEGKCQISRDVSIAPGAVIRNAVVGPGCAIGPGALVENACLWQKADVRQKARISSSVVCDGALVRRGAEISDGCALGHRAVIGEYALLRPGVRVCPFGKAAPGAVVARSVTDCDGAESKWSAAGAECLSPEQACLLCGAYAQSSGVKRVLLGYQDAQALAAVAGGALCAHGVHVYSCAEATGPMLRALIPALDLDGGVFVSSERAQFFTRDGSPLSTRQQAAMDACALRQEMPGMALQPGKMIPFSGAEAVYLSHLLPREKTRPLYSPLAVFCDSPSLANMAREGLLRLGARDARMGKTQESRVREGETGFLLSESGESLTVMTEGSMLSAEEKTMLLLSICQRRNGKLYDLPNTPRAAAQLSPLEAPDASEGCRFQRLALEDALASMLLIAEELKRGPLDALTKDLPVTHVLTMEVPCRTGDKGRVLHALCDQVTLPYTLVEGMRVTHPGGFASIVPDAHRPLVRVTGEAPDGEFARELCDFYFRKIQNIAKAGGEKQTMP